MLRKHAHSTIVWLVNKLKNIIDMAKKPTRMAGQALAPKSQPATSRITTTPAAPEQPKGSSWIGIGDSGPGSAPADPNRYISSYRFSDGSGMSLAMANAVRANPEKYPHHKNPDEGTPVWGYKSPWDGSGAPLGNYTTTEKEADALLRSLNAFAL
jgi:hypothetical protein